MTDKPVPLTREGKAKLEIELEQLRVRRREVAEMIHNALEQGTSQNDAEYDDAKLEQGRVEGRVMEVEDLLRRARIIDEDGAHHAGRVMIGSGVELDWDGAKRHYQIVGAPEADAAHGKISNESPVGAALLGKAVGDVIDINAPKGVIKVKVLKID
ncbi:MAG: transcription elongation factor GreA [Dehalococcoidia bacterium]|jgi:transcription elongation factor GreA|nr:transcription elongation factor GreA [Dehalococcoidia bacterium]MBK9343556.1 transcription elongation factor GreA [Dehalococcoidia bacterium]MBK9547163.1 transcription elongation factor GreA [Dehalococcoidia bacterium]MCC6266464.1 transcription elongation factor GreA [Dehalococcoidia bacterium]